MKASMLYMMKYNAWANRELLKCLKAAQARVEVAPMLGLIHHYNSMAALFSSRLAGSEESQPSDEVSALDTLCNVVSQCDEWYVSYVSELHADRFDEKIAFIFLDGDRGCMTRGEILMHVALHSSLHRGEVYRMLQGSGVDLPWDTYAVFLHGAEPARRMASSPTSG